MRLEPGRVEAWRPQAIAIEAWTVLRLARYRRPDDAPPPVRAAAAAMAARATALAAPAARLRRVRVAAAGDGRVRLLEGATFSGHAVVRHVAAAPEAVAFALTLGPALESEVAQLGARNEPLDAYLLDLAGWAGLEASIRALRQALRERFPGRRLSHRLGPGHRDWPIEEQRELMPLVDGPDAPVRLSEHGVLVPLKSVTGLFAIHGAAGG